MRNQQLVIHCLKCHDSAASFRIRNADESGSSIATAVLWRHLSPIFVVNGMAKRETAEWVGALDHRDAQEM